MGQVNELLSRLSGVKKTGPAKWQAKCPAHDDRTPSLAVAETPDGRILVHCFGGCGAADIVESLGLAVTDLFPERLGEFKRTQPFSAWDALQALRSESAIVAIAAGDVADGKVLASTADRVAIAAGRIATALEYVHGSR